MPGNIVERAIAPSAYREYFGESTEAWSHLKSPYYLPAGYPDAGIRAHDPCLSCSTHAVGQMPMLVQRVGPDGTVLDEMRRH